MPPLEELTPFLTVTGAVLVALTGFLAGILAWRRWPSQRRKQEILDAQTLLTTGATLLESMRTALDAMRAERDLWHEQHGECERRMALLTEELSQAKERIAELEREVQDLQERVIVIPEGSA